MIKEPTTEEIPDNGDDRPATNRDVASLQREVRGLRKDMAGKASREDVTMASKELVGRISDVKEEMRAMKEEILHHFDAAMENIEEELKGANADEISLLNDVRKDHETRITAMERQVGMR